jgi:hypothetical protein
MHTVPENIRWKPGNQASQIIGTARKSNPEILL